MPGSEPTSVVAIPNKGWKFDYWEVEQRLFGDREEIIVDAEFADMFPDGTEFIAYFVYTGASENNNTINAHIGSRVGGTAFYIEVRADHPLATDIELKYMARGDFSVPEYGSGSGQLQWYDFEGPEQSTILKKGENSWSLLYYPGINSAGTISSVNWAIVFTEFSDNAYDYKKGIVNGVDVL